MGISKPELNPGVRPAIAAPLALGQRGGAALACSGAAIAKATASKPAETTGIIRERCPWDTMRR